LGATYRYAADDYALYNLTGGAGTAAAPSVNAPLSPNRNSTVPGRYIGSGQSFMVGTKVGASGTVSFTNAMRLGTSGKNTQFFKPEKESKTTELEKNRIWLNMTNTEGAFKQLLVGYIEGATNETEQLYDGTTFDGNKYLDFYSVNNGSKLTIQGRALPFTNTDIVPLGYKSTIDGDFTISIDQVDGSMTTQAIYLEDKKTGIIHDLTASNYTFSTATGVYTDRLVLRYTNKTLGTGDFENVENGILVSVKDKVIKVLSSKETVKEVVVYDVSGKVLYDKKKVNNTELQITNLQSADQVLIVKVILENGFTTTKKIVF
jgi:hypothetical protein